MKRFISLFLACVLLVGAVPAMAATSSENDFYEIQEILMGYFGDFAGDENTALFDVVGNMNRITILLSVWGGREMADSVKKSLAKEEKDVWLELRDALVTWDSALRMVLDEKGHKRTETEIVLLEDDVCDYSLIEILNGEVAFDYVLGVGSGRTRTRPNCTKLIHSWYSEDSLDFCGKCGAVTFLRYGEKNTASNGSGSSANSASGTDYAWSYGSKENIYGSGGYYTTTRPLVFSQTVEDCKSFTVELTVTDYSGTYPSGTWKVYAKNLRGQWIHVGEITVPRSSLNKPATAVIRPEKCPTFTAIAFTGPVGVSGSWTTSHKVYGFNAASAVTATPKPAATGGTGTPRGSSVSWDWGAAENIYGSGGYYWTLYPSVFAQTIENCKSFTIDFTVTDYSGVYPSGTHKVYARNIKGQWIYIGDINVPRNSLNQTVTTTIRPDKCSTFTAIATTGPAGAGGFRSSVSFYDFK